MQSRVDIYLGKPVGTWFPRRNGEAYKIGLTGVAGLPKVAPHERATIPATDLEPEEEPPAGNDRPDLADPF